jgi:metacaspase-1
MLTKLRMKRSKSLDINTYRNAFVHGIGRPSAGFSVPWREAFNEYLNFPVGDYIEVLWSAAYPAMMQARNVDTPTALLTPQEQVEAVHLRKTLETILATRRPTKAPTPGKPALREWPEIATPEAFGLPVWILDPRDYIGEFIEYLVNRSVRNAVKEKFKQQMRLLAGQGDTISIIAHSWGTVVAYESLIDLEGELPNLKLANLFTLGSPLWMVHYLLDERSGRKPRNTSRWVNIYAQGDVIGAGLKPGFQADQDFAVPNFGTPNDLHNSYFYKHNTAVQHDIVAKIIRGG